MVLFANSKNSVPIQPSNPGANYSWTEEYLTVGSAHVFREDSEKSALFSIRLELQSDTPTTSTTAGKSRDIQLVIGLEEKDITPTMRLIGRHVILIQQREKSSVQIEDLLARIDELEGALQKSESTVKYLNDSLHHHIQVSRGTNL